MEKVAFAILTFLLLAGMQATSTDAAFNIKTINLSTGTTNDGWEKGENIALNAYTEVYNPPEEHKDPSKAVDGNKNTYVSMGQWTGSEAWLMIDLEEKHYLYEIHLYAKRSSSQFSDLPKISIQISPDKEEWKTIDLIPLPNDPLNLQHIKTDCKGEKARFVRIFRPKSDALMDIINIFEVEVYEAIDVLPPTVKITDGPENGSIIKGSEKNGATFTFKWKGEDNAPSEDILYSYRLGKNSKWSEWTTETEVKYTNYRSEGKYLFEVRVKDISGNLGNTDSRWFYIDNTKPQINIIWPKPGYLYITLFGREILPWIKIEDQDHAVVVGKGRIEVTVSDRGSGVREASLFLMDLNPNTPVEIKKSSELKDGECSFNIYNGEHVYKIIVFDNAGRSNSATIKITGILTGIDPPGCSKTNSPPYQTSKPSGVLQGKTGKEYTFTCTARDVEGDKIYYLFNWGDGSSSGWIGPYKSYETAKATHSWNRPGVYEIRVKVRDCHGNQGDWYAFTEIKIKDSKDENNQQKDLNSNIAFKKTEPKVIKYNRLITHQPNINPISKHTAIFNNYFNSHAGYTIAPRIGVRCSRLMSKSLLG